MPQKVFTRDTIDFTTGEHTKQENIFVKHVDNKEHFIRTYIEDIGALAKCSGAEKGFMLCCLKYLEFNSNEFILTPERRASIAVCANIKPETLNSAVSRLVKKCILIRKSGNTYIINPKIFFFGTDIERGSVIKATMVYVVG